MSGSASQCSGLALRELKHLAVFAEDRLGLKQQGTIRPRRMLRGSRSECSLM